MLYRRFADICISRWSKYRIFLKNNQKNISSSGEILYPNMAVINEFDDGFSFQLNGASRIINGLSVKKLKIRKLNNYFDLFNERDSDPALRLSGDRTGISNVLIAHRYDGQDAIMRFPYIKSYGSQLVRHGGRGSLVTFGDDFKSAYFSNCMFLSKREERYRAKQFVHISFFSKNITGTYLNKYWDFIFEGGGGENRSIAGISTIPQGGGVDLILSQLQSLYLSDGIHETTIGEFINLHPDIIRKAFSCGRIEYEKTFKWVDLSPGMDVNPDLMIERSDGYFDIVDLKLAKIDRLKLYRGASNRRRLVDYVNEGISQVVNYKRYFDFQANAEWVERTFNIKVKNPNLYVIVGNSENLPDVELEEALRMHAGTKIVVMNYDSFASLCMSSVVASDEN